MATSNRDNVIRLSTYHAAVYGWYDTSVEAQQSDALTISVMDMSSYEKLEPDATHKFYVMINASGYMVTRRTNGAYEVKPHDQVDRHREERELRAAVMDTALWYVTGEGSGYILSLQAPEEERSEARNAAIAELLEGEEPDIERYGGEIVHAVMVEVEPSIMIAPANEDEEAPVALRQWRVSFGDNAACEVGFFGYDTEDSQPFLVPVEADELLDESEE